MPDVVVAVPAHNEADSIEACLRSVLVALTGAHTDRTIGFARVGVVAHRCDDDTADRARAVLERAQEPFLDGVVISLDEPLPVGAVRSRLIEQVVGEPPLGPDVWVFSTDADSTVPPDWVGAIVTTANASGADLVAGMTELVDWQADERARQAYQRLISAGFEGAGLHGGGHRHVYAANLAVRLSAYQRAGGFPALPHGEEHGLLRAVRETGGTVLSTLRPIVRTSARMPGRAHGGLGALLADLAENGERR